MSGPTPKIRLTLCRNGWPGEVETRKRAFQDTASLVAERGATFCPLVLEACGRGWSQAFRGVVAWIASESRTARGLSTDLPRDASLRIAQRISCTLSQGKRARNPETFCRVCQRVVRFGWRPGPSRWLVIWVFVHFVRVWESFACWRGGCSFVPSSPSSVGCAGVSLRRVLLVHRVVFDSPVHKLICVCAQMHPAWSWGFSFDFSRFFDSR